MTSRAAGSSPRVRGAHARSGVGPFPGGLIPARAGSTYAARGGMNDPPGSSPRVRGARGRVDGRFPCVGLIPARAGSTGISRAPLCKPRAHPRACGEHVHGSERHPWQPGSSPRVRGAPTAVPTHRRGPGLIPARAGSTSIWAATSQPSRAHPRACGEHSPAVGFDSRGLGSSPRVRGAHLLTCDDGAGGLKSHSLRIMDTRNAHPMMSTIDLGDDPRLASINYSACASTPPDWRSRRGNRPVSSAIPSQTHILPPALLHAV